MPAWRWKELGRGDRCVHPRRQESTLELRNNTRLRKLYSWAEKKLKGNLKCRDGCKEKYLQFQSEGEKQVQYINTYTWNRVKWYWRTYLQDKNGRCRCREETLGTEREGCWGEHQGICTPPCVKQPATGLCSMTLGTQGELRDTRKGWGGGRPRTGGHTRTHGQSTLLCGRRQHRVVKWLLSNKK